MAADVTQLLQDVSAGEQSAMPELLASIQGELRRLAEGHMRRERPDHTLQPTALVNEAFLKLVDQRERGWESRGHFLAIASHAMRRVLLEHARARLADKRGGGAEGVTLFEVGHAGEDTPEAIVALEAALSQFEQVDPEGARVVELRWYGDLENSEVAACLGVSTRTVERSWRAARAWLRERLEAEGLGGEG